MDHVVVLLLDSLNRHLLAPYGGKEIDTPNLDRLAKRSVRFDRHFAGSLPCIPARHDLLCGSLDFLHRPWGSIEGWERPITFAMRKAGIVTKLVTDHPHLFEAGGENYHGDFTAWDYQRGHESDHWQTVPDRTMVGTPTFGRAEPPYHWSRRLFRTEEDFPGPKTMRAAAQWLDENAALHDHFFLLVDEFDPHEPFDTPEPYASMYDRTWSGPKLIWPPYLASRIDPDEGRQIRAQYAGKVTMIDAWLGRVLDALDRNALWDRTLVIALSDHGHYLGEHDRWGKPPSEVFDVLGRIPLFMAWPGCAGGTSHDALTTTVDVSATILDALSVPPLRHATHGASLLPLMRGETRAVRELVVQGYFGQRVNVIHGDMKLMKGVVDPNALAIYSNRWSTLYPYRLPDPDERATLGPYMKGTGYPVIRQPLDEKMRAKMIWTWGLHTGDRLFDIEGDPDETRDLSSDAALLARSEEMLRAALTELGAPPEQVRRLGLAR